MGRFLEAAVMGSACAAIATTAWGSPPNEADRIFHATVSPGEVYAGAQFTWGNCPCFRWTVKVERVGGVIETRDFIISSDALFKFQQTATPQFDNFAMRSFTFGAVEALYKAGHVGIGFNGITIAEDRDRGYSDLFKTGVNLIFRVIDAARARLDFRTGYKYENLDVNEVIPAERHQLPQVLSLSWNNGGSWSGTVVAGLELDAQNWTIDPSALHFVTAATLHADLFSIKNFVFGMSSELSYERDPWRKQFGLSPDTAILGLYFDLRFDMGAKK